MPHLKEAWNIFCLFFLNLSWNEAHLSTLHCSHLISSYFWGKNTVGTETRIKSSPYLLLPSNPTFPVQDSAPQLTTSCQSIWRPSFVALSSRKCEEQTFCWSGYSCPCLFVSCNIPSCGYCTPEPLTNGFAEMKKEPNLGGQEVYKMWYLTLY